MTVPPGWTHAQIGDLCDLINGKAFKPKDWSTSGLPIIRIQNLNNPNASFNYCDFDVEGRFLVDPGELLFAWSGTPGTSFGAHIWNGPKAVLNQHIFRIRFDEDQLDKSYFRRAINAKLDELIGKAPGGVGLAHVTKGKFEATEIALPPLAEQRRIVAKLDALTAHLARARAELDRVPVLASRLREAVLKQVFAFEFQANELDDAESDMDAAEAALGQLVEFNPKHAKAHDRSQSVSFVPMASVSDVSGEIVSQTARPLLEIWTGYTHFADGDVIFAKITPCMENGKAAVVSDLIGGLGCGSTEFYVMRPGPELRARILWYLLRSKSLRSVAATKMTGAVGQRRVPRQYLESLRIRVRSLVEQDAAIRKLDFAFARADRLEAEAARARALIDRLESALLAKAFRGELVPQDPNDEPAQTLLDRIRTRRAAAPKPKHGWRKRETA